jgi:hypothetical protein
MVSVLISSSSDKLCSRAKFQLSLENQLQYTEFEVSLGLDILYELYNFYLPEAVINLVRIWKEPAFKSQLLKETGSNESGFEESHFIEKYQILKPQAQEKVKLEKVGKLALVMFQLIRF